MAPRKKTRTAAPKRRARRPAKRRAQGRHGWALLRLWLLAILGLSLVVGALWVVYLDWTVRDKFDGKKWSLPARVYARPLELYEGMALVPELFDQELQSLGYRPVRRISGPGQWVKTPTGGRTGYEVHSRGFEFWDGSESAHHFMLIVENDRLVRLLNPDGSARPLVRLEPEEIGGIYPAHMEDRVLVRLAEVPELLGAGLLAVEDREFYDHWGFSVRGITRAAIANLRSAGVVQGGSTITQQLVKNFYLTQERTLWRKGQEAVMAVLLERRYSKADILETYINEVYLGQSGPRGVHGFGLAAQHYFRQPLSELSTEQIALLVGLAKGASFYNPWRHPQRATTRRNLVLQVMAQERLISPEEHERARQAPLAVVDRAQHSLVSYPAFVDLVKRQLQRDYREADLRSEGLRIFTSLSPMVQRQAEAALSGRIERLARQHDDEQLQGGMVITSVGAGEVLAVVGDRNPRFDGFNRALDARRPVGSLIKPFIYLTALESGAGYHPASIVSDAPVVVEGRDGQRWEPRNANRKSHGDVLLYQALVHSYNQANARLGMELGLDTVYRTLRRAGFEGLVPPVPAMLLGSVDMSAYEVAGIYHTLAAEGVYTPLRAIREVLDADGQPLRRYPLTMEQRFSPESAFQTQHTLQWVLREGTGRSVYQRLPENLPLAGKTGTTNDRRDSWFAGFSGEHLAVTWLGHDDNSVTPLTGASGALQAWADVFSTLPTQGLTLYPPGDVSFDWVDSETGLLSAEHCANAVWLPLREQGRPSESGDCDWRRGGQPRWWQFWR
ncbi:penicillin-binding protein 1B [Marinimicrobium alkaliphilum]|uniref:penicillin-binding protein 1B n=1 Tax=Marinimicrobium alkaliphilum TaxID=2202654 RepID=UPI000DB9E484|nr:penicillin-binding protein 1B [Marinimicrobium alkaliphilum]